MEQLTSGFHELLMIIFSFTGNDPPRSVITFHWCTNLSLFAFRYVCRGWKHIIGSQPRLSISFTTQVAQQGWLSLLQWARANRFYWDGWTCGRAAAGGHLEVLRWARANGCPWDKNTCAYAASEGHLSVLKWARVNGCPWNEETCADAA